MKAVIFSRNTPFFKPTVVMQFPIDSDKDYGDQVSSLMDLYDRGFFIHNFNEFTCANLLFDIKSQYGREGVEKLMISIIVDADNKINTTLTQEVMEGFSMELQKLQDAYKAFYIDSKMYDGDTTKYTEIEKLLLNFHKNFPVEDTVFQRKDAKVLLYGLSYAGKTTIIRCRRKTIFKNLLPTMSVDISRILVNNVSLLTYDTPGHPKFREMWKPYLKNQDGLIFVLDVTEEIKYPDARKLLHMIASLPEMKHLPLLILFNKIDLHKPDINYLSTQMGIEKLNDRPLKCFLTSAIKNINIDEAFNWLSMKIYERALKLPESDVGVIFAIWDENLGIKIVSTYPQDAFDDPELIAIRCFSVSQFVFGGEQFRKTSVILPLPNIKAKAGIFFDYVFDENVRGGMLPLSLIVYCNEDIPSAVIDQYKMLIFENFSYIKEDYQNKDHVTKYITEIYNALISMLVGSKEMLRILKLAEVRYRSLFKAARDAILIVDKHSGIILDANDQAIHLFLLTPENLIGLHLDQLKLSQGEGTFQDRILSQLTDDKHQTIVLNVENSQHKIIPIEVNSSEIQMEGQDLIQCIIRDITERRKTEKKLIESESKYRHLFEDSPFSITLLDRNGDIIDVNPAMENLMEYLRDELIGKKFVELPIIDRERVDIFELSLKKEEISKKLPMMQIEFFKKNGESLWGQVQTSLIVIEGKKYYQIIIKDITEQIEIENDIKNVLEYENILARVSSRFISTKDIDDAINASLYEMGSLTKSLRVYLYLFYEPDIVKIPRYEWTAENTVSLIDKMLDINMESFPWLKNKLLKEDYLYVHSVLDLPENANAIKLFMEYRQATSLLICPITINEKPVGILGFDNIIKAEVRGDEKFSFLSIISDILSNSLERIVTNIELKSSKESLRVELDRSQFYKELFIHDVNDIFNKLLSIVDHQTIERIPILNRNVYGVIKSIREQCVDGDYLVSIITKLTQLEELNISNFKVEIVQTLNEVVENILTKYQERDISVKITPHKKKYYVIGNAFIKDALENLVISSIKYNKKKSIEIEIRISRTLKNDRSYVKLEFADNEFEISDIKKEQILEVEKRQNEKLRGVLLGFLLIERILEKIEGEIYVEGNRFVFQIPEDTS